MRLLAITAYYKPAYVFGGPVRSTAALFEGLVELGVEVVVITTDANSSSSLEVPLLTPIDVDGVQVIYCPTMPGLGSPFYSPIQIAKARSYIRNADIVNLQTFWGYATWPLTSHCISNHIPYFVSLRGQLMDYAMKQAQWTKRLKKRVFMHLVGYRHLNGAVGIHCTSRLEAAHLRAYPISAPTFIAPNGLDVSVFRTLPPRGQLRKQYQISDDALVMVMIGRIHSVKNPSVAVATLSAAQSLSTDVHLIVVGPDEHNLESSLRRQARDAGCATRIHFTGLLHRNALLQAMADADLLIMPSKTENFGMSAAEAMAAGLPILTADTVPVGDWAERALAGRTVSCDETSFCRAAVDMLSSPAQLVTMGQNGKAAAGSLFDHRSIARQMLTQLERLTPNNRGCNV